MCDPYFTKLIRNTSGSFREQEILQKHIKQ